MTKKKILYAINGTGQGHISRAKSLIPYLRKYVDVDILISGKRQALNFSETITYDFSGFIFIYRNGGVDWIETIRRVNLRQFIHDVQACDLSAYDFIVSDFEPVSAWASLFQKKPCLNVSHQASFYSLKAPRPFYWFFFLFAELFLRYFAISSQYIGVHFQSYSSDIFCPILKDEIIQATPESKGHITIYLPAYSLQYQRDLFMQFPSYHFEIFHSDCLHHEKIDHLTLSPLSELFKYSLITASGYISNAGFESNAEALYLQKPLLCIPQRGQYEQSCNGAALKQLGVVVASRLTYHTLSHWLENKRVLPKLPISDADELAKQIVKRIP